MSSVRKYLSPMATTPGQKVPTKFVPNMVAHQAGSTRAEKSPPVLIILKNVLALVASIEHMIYCAGIFDA